MPKSQAPSRSRSFRGLLLGIVAVLLVAFTATIQVAHVHDIGASSHADCALCSVAHSGITLFEPVELPLVAEQADTVESEPVESPTDSFIFSFYSRPPPAVPASV